MDNLKNTNAIIIDGEVYKIVYGSCQDCAFTKQCNMTDAYHHICEFFDSYERNNSLIFRYSPELTELINDK